MTKCECGGELEFNVSCCTDMDCCGIEHSIGCKVCWNYVLETFDYSEFEDKWVELGGKKGDLQE